MSAIAIAVAVVGGAGCEEKKSADADADAKADASADANASASADAMASAEAGPRASADAAAADRGAAHGGALPICRVMASENGPAATADATDWLDLAAQASFTVRRLETGRELRFEGPGRVRACADDVALVATGSAVGLPGSGEAPGAEQWVATACGVARWASGVHRFTGARDACRLQSSLGTVQLYVPDDVAANEIPVAVDGGTSVASDAGAAPASLGTSNSGGTSTSNGGGKASPWRRIDGRHAFALRPRGAVDGAPAVKSALVACERAADAVQKLSVAMLAGPRASDGGAAAAPAPPIGELAEESVVARGVARAACAVAAVRVALAGPSPALEARLAAASIRWRGAR